MSMVRTIRRNAIRMQAEHEIAEKSRVANEFKQAMTIRSIRNRIKRVRDKK